MHQIMSTLQGYTFREWLEFAVLAVIAALLMGRYLQVVIFALIALAIDLFLPVAFDIIQSGSTSSAGGVATDIVNKLPGQWMTLIIEYGAFLVAISILFVLKSFVLRRG
jgi:hypothetical protein